MSGDRDFLSLVDTGPSGFIDGREFVGSAIMGPDAVEMNGTPAVPPLEFVGKTATQLLRERKTPPPSLLGDGLFPIGMLGLFYGAPGLGKSWLALLLAASLASGRKWVGLETPPEPKTVGIVTLELDDSQLWKRFAAVVGAYDLDPDDGALERVRTISTDDLPRGLDLRDEDHLQALMRWSEPLDLLILDPLSRMHSAVENSAEEMGSVLGKLDRLRHETQTAVLVVHHSRKAGEAGPSPRGSSRLESDSQLRMLLRESRGELQLKVEKSNFAPLPDPIWLRQVETGVLVPTDGPDEEGLRNRVEVVRGVVAQAGRWISVRDIATELRERGVGMNDRTLRRYLALLVGAGELHERQGPNRTKLFRAPDGSDIGHDVSDKCPTGDNVL